MSSETSKDISKSEKEAGLGGSPRSQMQPEKGNQGSQEEMLEHIPAEAEGKGGLGGSKIYDDEVGQNKTGIESEGITTAGRKRSKGESADRDPLPSEPKARRGERGGERGRGRIQTGGRGAGGEAAEKDLNNSTRRRPHKRKPPKSLLGLGATPVCGAYKSMHTGGIPSRSMENFEGGGDPQGEQARLFTGQGLPGDIASERNRQTSGENSGLPNRRPSGNEVGAA